MTEPNVENKILGVSKGKYLKTTYTLLMVSAVFGVLSSLLGLLGISLMISGIASVIGIAGLVFVLVGFYAFSEHFSDVELSHFKYMGFVFLGSVVAGLVVVFVLGKVTILFNLAIVLLNIAALAFMYVGYTIFLQRAEVTKETVMKELHNLKDRVKALKK